MKKFFVIVAILSLTACTASKPAMLDENTATSNQLNQNASSELEVLKAKDDTNDASSKEGEVSQKENKMVEDDNLIINKNTTNMNNAIITTSFGVIKVSLNNEKAPISVENFKKYASEGYFNGTIFHRVMPGFMVQGGGFDESGSEKATKAPIKNEATNGLLNNRGTLAMARTPIVDSATSQFFINLVDNAFLNYSGEANYGYAVFAEVTEGVDVVDKIAGVKTGQNGPHGDWPKENIIIESVELTE